MPCITIYISEAAEKALIAFAEDHGRTVEDLAEAAVEEAAMASVRAPALTPETDNG